MTDPFEKVKIELRSILLSSKHGVAVADIQSDYEQLTCQRLLHKELGFADIQSLMRAMPDVAEEVRLPNGQIIYHAVCDESTAHIQKLISNQISKKKKTKYSVGRGRGRGGYSRGRGGRVGHDAGGSLGLSAKPRFLQTLNRGRPTRSYPATSRAAHGSGDNRSNSFNSDLIDYFTQKEGWDVPVKNEDRKPFLMSRAIVGRGAGAAEQTRLVSDNEVDELRHVTSPMYNLKIGISQTGKRVISKFGSPVGKNGDAGNFSADEGVSVSSTQCDLRDTINRRRAQHAAVAENHCEDDGAVGRKDFNLNTERNKRVMKENRFEFKKDLPPRFQKKNDKHGGSVAQEKQAFQPVHVSNEPPYHFSDENTIYSIDESNWVPPEDGELYLQTYYNYFAQRGVEAPEIAINPGKCNSQMGYYGRLMYNNMHYYPLQIMQNEEQARQNVARTFCLKNYIPLLTTEQHRDKPTQNLMSSSVSHTPKKVLHDQSLAESNSKESQSEVKPSQASLQLESSKSAPTSVPAHKKQSLPEILEKIYKILTPNGIWVNNIANRYLATYGEAITVDFLSLASQWPDYFTLEELAGNRFTVYPVPNALTKEAAVNVITEVKTNGDNKMPVPPAVLPPVGSEVQVMFSFAYSATDLYVQRADILNLVYEIDELLNRKCLESSAPEIDAITVNSMMAANYEEGWYRAQIVAVEAPMVTVYFIDYGNKEKVSISDLRPIPHEKLTLDTPSFAIKCAVRQTKAGEWCKDITTILTDLIEKENFLLAKILEHKGDQCVIDLHTPDGSLVNDVLIQPAPTLTPQPIKTTPPKTEAIEQEKRQFLGSPSVKLFADDPEPLVIPECDTFVVYVCRVMSENTVLLRIVDDDYSEKLDQVEQQIAENFYSWPVPKNLKRSNIYAGMVLAGVDDAEDVEYDEEGKEKLSDQNKYYRVRMLKENKDGNCDCYLPDHGHDDIVNLRQLREIDPDINLSLPYQAVMAKLHGLDKMPDLLKPMTVRLLIKLLIHGSTFFAIKKGNSAENVKNQIDGIDSTVMTRVRKIISCMNDVQPALVSKIYHDVYKESLDNVEEVIKNIPGFGYWKESLIVDLIDTSQDDGDININEFVLATIEEMNKVQSQGGNVENVWQNLFSSNISQADTDSGSCQEGSDGWAGKNILNNALNKLDTDQNGTDNEEKLSRVQKYVQDLNPATQDDNVKPASGRVLYTWNTKPETQAAADSSCHTPSTSSPSLLPTSISDNSHLPKFWAYPLLELVSLQIVRVESPSYFVVIPMEQRGALGKLEMAITQYFSSNSAEPATSFSDDVLYATKSKDVCHRTLYVNMVEDMVKVFLPDHHSYDTVHPSELFLLPQQFYSLPFLAHRSRLGGVVPTGHEWPEHVIKWFKDNISNKCLYAMVTGEEHSSSSDPQLPGTLVVRLIDTSYSEDLVVDEYMESQGMAALDPNGD